MQINRYHSSYTYTNAVTGMKRMKTVVILYGILSINLHCYLLYILVLLLLILYYIHTQNNKHSHIMLTIILICLFILILYFQSILMSKAVKTSYKIQ